MDPIMIEEKTDEQIKSIVLGEVRKSSKCESLSGGTVIADGHPGDWIFLAEWSGAGLSEDCRNEIAAILSRLKRTIRLKQ
jgi:hypothetical protein